MEESPQRCTATCRLGAATRNFSPALANMHLDHAPDRPASKQLPGSSYTQPSVAIPSPSIIRLDTPYPPPPPIPTPSPSLSIVHHRRRYQLTTSHFPCALPAAGFPPAVNAATLRASHRQPRRPGENIYGYVNHLLFRYDPPATRYRYPLPPQFPNLPASPPHWTSPPPQLRHLGHSRVKCPSTVTQPFRLHRGLLHTSSTVPCGQHHPRRVFKGLHRRWSNVHQTNHTSTSGCLHLEVRQCSFRLTTHRQHAPTSQRTLRWLLTRRTATQWLRVAASLLRRKSRLPLEAVV